MALGCRTDDDEDDRLTPSVEADGGEVSGSIESRAFRKGCIRQFEHGVAKVGRRVVARARQLTPTRAIP